MYMKIATYNVWNENKGKGNRYHQLINEINAVNADIIALQEVTTCFFNDFITKVTDYKYCVFRKYKEEDEGLAILSKYPIKSCFFLKESEDFAFSAALNVSFEVEKLRFSFTNVHLPWDSAKAKEEQIVAIDRYIHSQKEQADYFIMLGDFNGSLNSSVHRYLLLGEQTINGNESNPYWDELSSSFSELNGLPLKPTLDFVKPSMGRKNTIYIPCVVDRIYIMDNLVDKILKSVEIFGIDISPQNNLSASDHYGVVAEVDFVK